MWAQIRYDFNCVLLHTKLNGKYVFFTFMCNTLFVFKIIIFTIVLRLDYLTWYFTLFTTKYTVYKINSQCWCVLAQCCQILFEFFSSPMLPVTGLAKQFENPILCAYLRKVIGNDYSPICEFIPCGAQTFFLVGFCWRTYDIESNSDEAQH